MLPDPFDVLEATLGPAARIVALDGGGAPSSAADGEQGARGVRVVRTADQPEHPAGNALHHLDPLPAGGLAAAVADLDRRFPGGRARLVVPDATYLATADHDRLVPTVLEVLRRDAGAPQRSRADLRLAAPSDDRDWHGITMLHRHAEAPGQDRSRGRRDDVLRWWVAGLRQLVGAGRARVLRAVRFGTPVAVGVLHWAPGAEVDDDHAGLAVVADVVVHPAHRGLGVARSLVDALVARHLEDFPRACVTGLAELPGRAAGAEPPAGWRRHDRLLALTRPED